MNKTDLLKDVRSLNYQITKNSPILLVILGITGMVTTVVMACKATPDAKEALNDFHQEQEEYEEFQSKPKQLLLDVKTVAPIYGPSVIMGGISIACIIGSYSINSRRIAALATAYSLSERTLHEYRNKVIETLGEKKEERIRDEIAKDRVRDNLPDSNEVIVTDGGDMLCYDSVFGRYFKSSVNTIRKAENVLNHRLVSEMYLSVNEFYDLVGLPPTKMGNELGWNIDNLIEFDFHSILMPDETTCLVVNYDISPRYDFRNLH